MNMKSLLSRLALIALFLLPNLTVSAQAEATAPADLDAGKALFRNYCATCHNKNMVADLTGPALGGTQERWAEFPEEDLYRWIRGSAAMIDEGHPRATELWAAWKPTVMNNFPQLTDQEIFNILGYIDGVYTGVYPPPVPGAAVAGGATATESGSNAYLYWILAFVLAALAIILARIISNMNYMLKLKEGDTNAKRRSLVQVLTSKGVIAFVIFALVVLGGYTTVNNAIMLGRQQGYAPEQPIKFSHETHAGINKIDCQYCHDGARRSKHSVIPAANTCMNCHSAIKVGSTYGTAELTKIYASIGWDPNEDQYIEDYENMSRKEIKKVYEKWIANAYTTLVDDELKENGEDIEDVVKKQWDGIVSSLTNKATSDNKIAGPIEWVRIHNLPDHAYFNHAQHVSVGKVECQTCHGPVEEMEVVQQYSPLSMGWCINCHRETQVQFEDNEYYQSYQLYHEQIKAGTRDGVTVEEIGGLECQKCHY